jgi:hypothetical protein
MNPPNVAGHRGIQVVLPNGICDRRRFLKSGSKFDPSAVRCQTDDTRFGCPMGRGRLSDGAHPGLEARMSVH